MQPGVADRRLLQTMKIKNWAPFYFIVGYHALLLVLIPIAWPYLGWSALAGFLLTYFLGGISITAGYHRLFSHKAYEAHPWLENSVLFFSTLAFQYSALMWSHDHRLHHKHVDTDEDPYSIEKGFWYAHLGWIFTQERQYNPALVKDLERNPRVMFQHRHFIGLTLAANAVVFGIACLFMHPLAALFAVTVARIFAIHHSTWFINSLAHTWGAKTYARELSAVDNAILAVLTFGEGYHNYHHAFASDYRNGIRWYHYDVTKWLIWLASKFGLAKSLRKVSDLRIQQQLVKKDRDLILPVLSREYPQLAHLRERLEQLSESFEERAKALSQQIQSLKSASAERREHLLEEIRHLQERVREDWRLWQQLTWQISRQVSLPH